MKDNQTDIQVPFLDLKLQYASIQGEVQEALQRVLDSSSFILGSEVTAFEKAFADFCETEFAVGVDSGTSALEMILRAYDIGPGDEVITAANTFIATVLPITYVGATPILVEMDPDTYQMDISKLGEKISPRTRAVIPVHLFGHPVDLDPLLEIARNHKLIIIEDACQAHGARYRRKRVGGFGHAAAFSFYPGKNLGAYGDGGMITTNDPETAEKLRRMRDYGQSKKYHHDEIGYNHRLDAMQAAILKVKLKYLDSWNKARQHNAAVYTEKLTHANVVCPKVNSYAEPVWHLYVIQVDERDRMRDYLQSKNISTGIHYPIPIHLQKAYDTIGVRKGCFPFTESAADRIISLPMYAELTEEQITYVVETIQHFQ